MQLDPVTMMLTGTAPVRAVMLALDRNRQGIVLIVDDDRRLIGTVTDGDVRRFLLAGGEMDAAAEKVMRRSPITAAEDASDAQLQQIFRAGHVKVVPVVDRDARPLRLVTLQELLGPGHDESIAVVMAGGEGRRLRPLTETVPKPLVTVGAQPILDRLVEGLASAGIQRIYIAVNYLREQIEERFGDGKAYGADIVYLREDRPRGSAGALGLLPHVPREPMLVLNGDIVTDVDFRRLRDYHVQHRAVVTVGAAAYRVQVPYGVLRLAGHHVIGIDEKPQHTFFCSAGLYVVDPEVLRMVPPDRAYHMTDLVEDVMREGLPVSAFPIHERWMDIGGPDELARANSETALS